MTNDKPPHYLCWLLGTSVLKIVDFALDLLVFLGAVAFTHEGMQEHFVYLHPSCRNIPCSSSPSGRDERMEVSFSRFKTRWDAELNLFRYDGLSLEALRPLFDT